ncbi:MAG: GNAT family N-acetyltransferase [Bacteroidales bacterium]|nr:GNAT family N-acetyltransferase [Bacteroidales bacterium]
MEITKYGVTLRRLTEDKIELLRNWRNDPKIQQYMEYREYITPEMQKKWFAKINNEHNFYFIIEYDGKEIGMTNLKDIDYQKGIAEPGIFIYDDSYLNTPLAFMVSCSISDFGFEDLGLSTFYGHVLKDNKRAKRFNKALGYKLCEGEDDKTLQLHSLRKEDYLIRRNGIVGLFKSNTLL